MDKLKKVGSPSPPPLSRFHSLRKQMVKSLVAPSVTKQQVADYWRQRRMIEEDHLSAAIKAAAHIRAQNLSDHDYRQFLDSLEDDENKENENTTEASSKKDEKEEIRVGIKDWWTKSAYAYLNEPFMTQVDKPRGRPPSTRLSQYFVDNSASLLTPNDGHLGQHGYQVS
ncbi:hypothetical protein Salat_1162800 [Sesamum alatum]|uniref:Uncharacterized protein n=1 Tax=Sesamum alatum TaxID=300844 RepID=A0AAE2CNG3_9LAMI|nr:hypothetical protein Salat_1162800 [Sesamum alatum]